MIHGTALRLPLGQARILQTGLGQKILYEILHGTALRLPLGQAQKTADSAWPIR